jgi:formate-dependent nitrite reductase cytochrome c552 subunit
MVTFKRLMAFAGIAVLGLGLAACSRNITRVEQVVAGPQACFECHSDTNTFLVSAAQQWANSKHASGETLNEKDGACKGCHTSEGFLAVASGTTIADVVENPTSIHCFTCHAPHTNGDFSLRSTTVAQKTLMNGVSYDLKAGNLCLACHRSRRNVKTYVVALTMSNRFGPHHGPQGDMLIGSNGYEYAGYEYGQTNHRSATTDGCLDCHMRTTSQNVVGGHSFNMAYGAEGAEILNTEACAKCHGEIGDFAEVGGDYSQDNVDILVAQLEGLLVNAGFITMDGETAVPNAVAVTADQAGAVYNLLLVKEDRSHGVHNPKYMTGLLQSSIDFMNTPVLTATHAQRAMGSARDKR